MRRLGCGDAAVDDSPRATCVIRTPVRTAEAEQSCDSAQNRGSRNLTHHQPNRSAAPAEAAHSNKCKWCRRYADGSTKDLAPLHLLEAPRGGTNSEPQRRLSRTQELPSCCTGSLCLARWQQ
ncbi:hypothetical protein CCHR01_18910 [Colletotrichum chrysophilum]|uniref:Uncharacterized protein n=1 Tax=Colletotrichum chrysophilum TaxID=1836956 RepID=A0AAD8ZZU9_9PEZI|nr:hypothetical protein CCHR01_18910 [Colletotrichum chrysophilum]